jgi:hypothetical protein
MSQESPVAPVATVWERQPCEGPEAYEAFAVYRAQGRDRSIRAVGRTLGKSTALIERWSSAHQWVRRVAAYDRFLDAERRRVREQRILEMEDRQASQLIDAAQALAHPTRAFIERIQQMHDRGEDPFASQSISELHRMAVTSVRHLPSIVAAERLIAGLSTESASPDAPASAYEARRRAERMSRTELEAYLLGSGVDDHGRQEFLRGLDDRDAP